LAVFTLTLPDHKRACYLTLFLFSFVLIYKEHIQLWSYHRTTLFLLEYFCLAAQVESQYLKRLKKKFVPYRCL
jgi:hypothetical protein